MKEMISCERYDVDERADQIWSAELTCNTRFICLFDNMTESMQQYAITENGMVFVYSSRTV